MLSLLKRHGYVALPLLLTGLAIHVLGHFVTDDGLISLRYARHWVQGHGIVWNPGEDPVEGYSNFSHVALGALSLSMGWPALTVLRWVNLGALMLTVLYVYAIGWRCLGSRVWAAAAAALACAHPPMVFWAGSGLEAGLYTMAVYWALYQAGCQSRFARWLTALPLLLAALTRFEGFAVAAAILGAHLLQDVFAVPRVRLRRSMGWAITFGLLYLVYFLWRWDYFGYPMPNSAYFKASSDSHGLLLWQFATEVPVVLSLALFAPWRRMGATGAALGLLIAAYAVGYYDVRPAISYYHRFFLPLYPGLALLATGALWQLVRIGGGRWPLRLVAAVAFLAVMVMDARHSHGGVEPILKRTASMNARMVTRLRTAQFLRANVPADRVVAVGDVGAVAYLIPHQVVDIFGLNDERFTHRYGRDRRGFSLEVFRRPPAALVMVSRARGSFKRRYRGDRYLEAEMRRLSYARQHRVLSPAERYHYFIYTLPGVIKGVPRPESEPDLSRGVMRAIDEAALNPR